jgi:hypothetical protein
MAVSFPSIHAENLLLQVGMSNGVDCGYMGPGKLYVRGAWWGGEGGDEAVEIEVAMGLGGRVWVGEGRGCVKSI